MWYDAQIDFGNVYRSSLFFFRSFSSSTLFSSFALMIYLIKSVILNHPLSNAFNRVYFISSTLRYVFFFSIFFRVVHSSSYLNYWTNRFFFSVLFLLLLISLFLGSLFSHFPFYFSFYLSSARKILMKIRLWSKCSSSKEEK